MSRTEWLWLGRRMVLAVIATVLVAGCTLEPRPSPTPTLAADGDPDGGDDDPACFGVTETADGPPLTIEYVTPFADHVAIARVVASEPAFFNTRDQAPPRPRETRVSPIIYTPYRLEVTQWLKGGADAVVVRVVAAGGQAGCITYEVHPRITLAQNRSYVVFLQPSKDAEGNRNAQLPFVLEAWLIDSAGVVRTVADGKLPVADVAAAVVEVAPTPQR